MRQMVNLILQRNYCSDVEEMTGGNKLNFVVSIFKVWKTYNQIINMSSFTNSQLESNEKGNIDERMGNSIEQFFQGKNCVLISKESKTSHFQYSVTSFVPNPHIFFVEIKFEKQIKVCFRYHFANPGNYSLLKNKINEANSDARMIHSKCIFEEKSRVFSIVTSIKNSEIPHDFSFSIKSLLPEMQEKMITIIKQVSNLYEPPISITDPSTLSKIESSKKQILKFKQYLMYQTSNYIQKSSPYSYLNKRIQHISGLPEGLVHWIKGQNCNRKWKTVEQTYKQICDRFQQNKKKGGEQTILSNIKFIRKDIENWQQSSNFSDVQLIRAHFQVQKTSIHSAAQFEGEKTVQKQAKLVCKTPKRTEAGLRSYYIEVSILKYLRNNNCGGICNFYVESLYEPTQIPPNLYSTYYEKNIADKSIQMRSILKLMRSLAEGLHFLQTQKITHRDLKPLNILCETNPMSAKIIDFGSAFPLRRSIRQSLKINDPLCTTKQYNLYYHEAPLEVKAVYYQHTFQQHEKYDSYAFGVMLQKLLLNQDAKRQYGDYIIEELNWIKNHTKIPDPSFRLSSSHIAILMKMLSKFILL